MSSDQNLCQPNLLFTPDFTDYFLQQIKDGNERYTNLMKEKRLEILNRIADRFFHPPLYRSVAVVEMEFEKDELMRYSAELTKFDYLIYRSRQTRDLIDSLFRPAKPISTNTPSRPPIICKKEDPLFELLNSMDDLDESIMDMHRQELRAMSEEQDRQIMEYLNTVMDIYTEDKSKENSAMDFEFSVTPYPVSDQVKQRAIQMTKNYIKTGSYFSDFEGDIISSTPIGSVNHE